MAHDRVDPTRSTKDSVNTSILAFSESHTHGNPVRPSFCNVIAISLQHLVRNRLTTHPSNKPLFIHFLTTRPWLYDLPILVVPIPEFPGDESGGRTFSWKLGLRMRDGISPRKGVAFDALILGGCEFGTVVHVPELQLGSIGDPFDEPDPSRPRMQETAYLSGQILWLLGQTRPLVFLCIPLTNILSIPVEPPHAHTSKLEVRTEQCRTRFQTVRRGFRFRKGRHPYGISEESLEPPEGFGLPSPDMSGSFL